MKILILGFAKIKYMPYLNLYVDSLDRDINEIHVLYWNRDLASEDLSNYTNRPNIYFHEFKYFCEDEGFRTKKVGSFVKFRVFAKKVIKENGFDFLIMLTTLPTVLLSDILTRKYSGRYVYDYRDSTYERFVPFKKGVYSITKNSYATFVSSDAFMRFLPEKCKNKVFASHNLLLDSLEHRDETLLHGIPSDKIRIAFWRFIRNEELNREIIRKIAKDARFEFHYYGREQQVALNLKANTKEINAENIFFHRECTPEERYEFVRNTDIIHNIYYDANMMLAMGNKYYDGLIFRLPQFCMPGSFMGDCVERAGGGMVCNPYEDGFLDKIYDYYKNLDTEQLARNCGSALESVLDEYTRGQQVIERIKTMPTKSTMTVKSIGGYLLSNIYFVVASRKVGFATDGRLAA